MDDDFAWRGPLPAPDFTMVPNVVFDDICPHLSGSEVKVLLCLIRASYGWHRPSADLSLNDVAQMAGVSRRITADALRVLEVCGIVTVERRDDPKYGHVASLYRLLITDDPRYIQRTPSADFALARAETAPASAGSAPPTRARSSYRKKTEGKKEGPSTSQRNRWKNDPKYGHVVE